MTDPILETDKVDNSLDLEAQVNPYNFLMNRTSQAPGKDKGEGLGLDFGSSLI